VETAARLHEALPGVSAQGPRPVGKTRSTHLIIRKVPSPCTEMTTWPKAAAVLIGKQIPRCRWWREGAPAGHRLACHICGPCGMFRVTAREPIRRGGYCRRPRPESRPGSRNLVSCRWHRAFFRSSRPGWRCPPRIEPGTDRRRLPRCFSQPQPAAPGGGHADPECQPGRPA